MLHRRTIRLIARELAGLATAQERARLESWIAADPEHRRTWTVLREAWRLSDGSTRPSSYDADVDWPQVRARIEQLRSSEATIAAERMRSRESFGRRAWMRRTAVRAAVVAAVLLVPWAAWTLARVGRHDAGMVEVSAPRGATKEAVLPDGSHVRLGAESSLRYAATFGKPDRTVELRGMAYFQVVHDPARPFVVRVRDGITTRVLGTRFVVLAYPENPGVEVAVEEGRVALHGGRPAEPEVAIVAGQVGRVGTDGVPTVTTDTSPDVHFAWLRGQLVLENQPLSRALVALGRWYDAQLTVKDPHLASRRISTTAGDIPLDSALAHITLALGARLERRGDTTMVVP